MDVKQNRITLKTIADECGYSVNTVSRALRNDPRISEETRGKIQADADKLGYIPNALAASLRSRKTHIIAIIVEEIHNPYYSLLLSQFDEVLKKQGYSSIILCTHSDLETERRMAQMAISYSVDGVLLFPCSNDSYAPAIFRNRHIPFVLASRQIPGCQADVVMPDDYAGGYLAGKTLINLGHRKIIYISGPANSDTQTQRQDGLIAAYEDAGLDTALIRVIPYPEIMRCIETNRFDGLFEPIDFTAVVSYDDEFAYYAMDYLQTRGLRFPEDLSICGFDNIHFNQPYLKPLSSISWSHSCNYPEEVVMALLDRIEHPNSPDHLKVIPVELFDEGTLASV